MFFTSEIDFIISGEKRLSLWNEVPFELCTIFSFFAKSNCLLITKNKKETKQHLWCRQWRISVDVVDIPIPQKNAKSNSAPKTNQADICLYTQTHTFRLHIHISNCSYLYTHSHPELIKPQNNQLLTHYWEQCYWNWNMWWVTCFFYQKKLGNFNIVKQLRYTFFFILLSL